MFIRLDPVDSSRIGRGFLIVLLVIIMGVSVAENQINSLTQNQEIGKAFNITNNKGIYSGYLLGYDYSTSFLWAIGKIYNNEQELVIEVKNFTFTIPLRMQFALADAAAMATEGRRKFVQESIDTKQSFEKCLKLMEEKIRISL